MGQICIPQTQFLVSGIEVLDLKCSCLLYLVSPKI